MIIKGEPEDFYVKEIIDLGKKKPGETFKYFIMWKRNLTTIRAIKIVSRKLKISKRRISFAGEKDKRAITEQYIAIRGLKEYRELYDFGNVKLKYVGSFSEPIGISDIIGNEFIILIRKITEDEKKKFLENVEIFKNGFVNYFDDQRFGDVRCNNHLIGKAIINRDWETACKILLTFTSEKENKIATEAREWLKKNWGNWKDAIKIFPKWLDIELAVLNYLINHPNDFLGALKKIHRRLIRMFIHSYQSYLWNKSVSEFIKQFTKDCKFIKLEIGEFCVPKNRDIIERLKNERFPIVGYDTRIKSIKEEYRLILERILDKERIKLDDFFFLEESYLSAEGSFRSIIEEPKNFEYEIKNNEILLKFILSKGSYATMFIKHLFV